MWDPSQRFLNLSQCMIVTRGRSSSDDVLWSRENVHPVHPVVASSQASGIYSRYGSGKTLNELNEHRYSNNYSNTAITAIANYTQTITPTKHDTRLESNRGGGSESQRISASGQCSWDFSQSVELGFQLFLWILHVFPSGYIEVSMFYYNRVIHDHGSSRW